MSIQEALQSTLRRVENAKASHKKIQEENIALVEYINNLMSATR